MGLHNYQPLGRLRAFLATQICMGAAVVMLIGVFTPWLHFESCQNRAAIESLGLGVSPVASEDIFGYGDCGSSYGEEEQANYPPTSISGIDLGGAGTLVLLLALVAIGATAAYASTLPSRSRYRQAALTAGFAAALAVLLTIYKVADTANMSGGVSIKVSWGAWLTGLAALLVVGSAIAMLRRSSEESIRVGEIDQPTQAD